ncbi:MAG: AraC family transcriptional regulator [Caulobacteraceae bacterium]|nr:AraC family transcriptional regulator [Caulobacteraceae bacterium]
MTATPRTIADPPDVLSELLRAVRLTGSVFMHGRFSAPFGVISPARWDSQDAMARLRHASVFHLIAEGECQLQTADGAVCDVRAGDLLLLPFTAEHRFWSGAPDRFGFGPDLVSPGPISGVGVVSHGGGGQVTRLVCGFLESAELMAAPLFRSLPSLLLERTGEDTVSGMLTATAAQILRQVDDAAPGAPFLLGRLMELLFVEVLRRHAARLPEGAAGMLAAMRDPVVARAIHHLHKDPARKWTIEDLAAEAGASRTVLAERFNQFVGKPPIEYLTGWRIQLAAERLRSSREPLARIAEGVGYESEAAFSRAFKREMGTSPGAWRAG